MRAPSFLSLAAVSTLALLAVYGCVGDDPLLRGPGDGTTGGPDAGADAAQTEDAAPEGPCKLDAPFGTPYLVPGLESPGADANPALTADELEIYFARTPPQQDFNGSAIFHARRPTLRAAFDTPTLFFDRPGAFDSDPYVSNDGSTIFASLVGADGGAGSSDVFQITGGGGATPVVGVNTSTNEGQASLDADKSEIWFVREIASDGGASQTDIFRGAFAAGVVTGVAPVAELNLASASESFPVLSTDKRTVFFGSSRTDGVPAGSGDNVWVAHRTSASGPFDPPSPVAELNGPASDVPRWLSPDGCRLYLRSDRGGDVAIYMAERPK